MGEGTGTLEALREATSAAAEYLRLGDAACSVPAQPGLDDAFCQLPAGESAHSGLAASQAVCLAGIAAGLAAGLLWAPSETALALAIAGAVAFAVLLAVRLYILWVALSRGGDTSIDAAVSHLDALPKYSVLVTLYDEAAVAPQLVEALSRLDYPIEKLEILLLLEACDHATRAALVTIDLPPQMRILTVPPGRPRTKPRALCYGLQHAQGEYIVVYDAEDRPEPDQLLKAARAFRDSDQALGCLQARLNIYNREQSILTRLFTVEYTSLFDATLPALAAAAAPVPLGGTSNHFTRSALAVTGGWDPWNVTEDADLGIRLARHGYRVEPLNSTTWEEAPSTFSVWLRQRTRWLKGWMQTYFVHMRDPVALWRELGWRGFFWFQAILGGGLLAALAHPWLIAGLILNGLTHDASSLWPSTALWWWAILNIVAVTVVSITLASLTINRRGFSGLALAACASPVLWLPISLAAYLAIYELMRRPFHWAKTPHGQTVRRLEHPVGWPAVKG